MNNINQLNHFSGNPNTQAEILSQVFVQNQLQLPLLPDLIEGLVNGILILNSHRELIYVNDCARQVLRQLNPAKPQAGSVPEEIWYVCQSLIESRNLFPHQYWFIEAKIMTDKAVTFQVRVQWLQLDTLEEPYLLLILKDPCQLLKNLAFEEAYKYNLTSRETEVWLLHRAKYTYKQIATELQITCNTVKKHMKNIHIKQKAVLGLKE